jgi:hypothetical protein
VPALSTRYVHSSHCDVCTVCAAQVIVEVPKLQEVEVVREVPHRSQRDTQANPPPRLTFLTLHGTPPSCHPTLLTVRQVPVEVYVPQLQEVRVSRPFLQDKKPRATPTEPPELQRMRDQLVALNEENCTLRNAQRKLQFKIDEQALSPAPTRTPIPSPTRTPMRAPTRPSLSNSPSSCTPYL